jgi:RHH-type proline utilization regulon transcriptional repressor/proline dehydrogenase/delta 1-pyrroline-5-carboxylate dehydrogenase
VAAPKSYEPVDQPTHGSEARDWLLPAGSAFVGAVAAAINQNYLQDEEHIVAQLAGIARLTPVQRSQVSSTARRLVQGVRGREAERRGLDAFLQQYDLSSQEGVILMCLAEALLRIPDDETADRLIADKIAAGDWQAHLGDAQSLFVNASTWGLMLTGRIVRPSQWDTTDVPGFLGRLVGRMGEPLVRGALRHAMRIMGRQFVMGRDIATALERARQPRERSYRHSFDMLGEAALCAKDAQRYFEAYRSAIAAVAQAATGMDAAAAPSISVKLSALHPRYEIAQRARALPVLKARLLSLATAARDAGITLTVDAEESDRLELSLELIEYLCHAPELAGWQGLGLAVQAYQKRALAVVDWLIELARSAKRRLNVRLVKGAYWDSEIKRAQERGYAGYPVFTRKLNTDVSYLACARRLLQAGAVIYPQFATHNAHTVAAILELAGDAPFEFQRLHGMGESLYSQLVGTKPPRAPCRVYAPVGSHEDLLPYLVRRLLENGANTSFVHRILDPDVSVDVIVADPVASVEKLAVKAHPRIPMPRNLFQPERLNSLGINLADGRELERLAQGIRSACTLEWRAGPIVNGVDMGGIAIPSVNPACQSEVVGEVIDASPEHVEQALAAAVQAQPEWNAAGASERANLLRCAADLYESHLPSLVACCVREGGRTIPDSIAEVREAVDFLRYYAAQGSRELGAGIELRGPVGESNRLSLQGRGVFVCISPWNFPLAIFTGQIAAALMAGNTVLAKPAEQTPLIAAQAVRLLQRAGIPGDVLHLLPGGGDSVGAQAVADERIAGVAFTGSTDTARAINQALAARRGAIATLIAETGGQNAMIADSSALPEQLVTDVVQSAFNSAGQRCSALRVLFVQSDIAPRVLELLAGAMEELRIGNPELLSTDIGPVIDPPARRALLAHVQKLRAQSRWHHGIELGSQHADGNFFAPVAMEIDSIASLTHEVFGPVLHVIRYEATALDKVIDAINATGYGLTLGIHSRIDRTAREIANRVRAGNVYVNRNMIGAMVGVQPFGGLGLSGTGPKAGGPHYLQRFATERTVSINTAAVGGNASLLAMSEE